MYLTQPIHKGLRERPNEVAAICGTQQLTRALVDSADLIFAMGPHHLERVEALGGGDKGYLLTEYPRHGTSGRAISDPMGAELEVYRATADELETEIRRVFDRLAAERVPGAS